MKRKKLLFIGPNDLYNQIGRVVSFETLHFDKNAISYHILSEDKICCIIFYFENGSEEILIKKITNLRTDFPSISIISILKDPSDVQLIWTLAKVGVASVLRLTEMHLLESIIINLSEPIHQILLKDLEIDEIPGFHVLNSSLKIIEQEYLSLMSIKELCTRLNVNESSLSREFKKANLLNPKRILMLFKIKHSIILMSNLRFNIEQIALRSGFSNVKRFIDCFYRVYECSPTEFRKKHVTNPTEIKSEILLS